MAFDKQAVATLAASIVVARGAVSVAKIQEALTDATFLLSPNGSNSRYVQWKEKHALTVDDALEPGGITRTSVKF